MGARRKILIGVLGAVVALLAINTLIVEGETKSAEVTAPGGQVLELPEGQVQYAEYGPPKGSPIVLIHCFACAMDWWDAMIPPLERRHRVVAFDLRGFGGSEKPLQGYSMEDQADLIAAAMGKLRLAGATVVGHSLGGSVSTALAERHPGLVDRLAIVDQAPSRDYESGGLPFTADLTFVPVLGPALWQVTPDFAIKDGLGVAFAPGFDVPDAFVEDFKRMTYTSYSESGPEENDYSGAIPLDRRIARARIPLLAIFGAEDQIYDARRAIAAYSRVPGAKTVLIPGSGHSPNVEKPARTARLVLEFASSQARNAGTRAG